MTQRQARALAPEMDQEQVQTLPQTLAHGAGGAPLPHRTPNASALVVIALAQLLVVLDDTDINLALPQTQVDLDFTSSEHRWVLSGYALAHAAVLPLGGRLVEVGA